MSIQHAYTLNSVTALAFYHAPPGLLLLLAEGSYLKIFHCEQSKLLAQCKVFDTQTIHGISVSDNEFHNELRVVIWGGRSFALLSAADVLSIISERNSTVIFKENPASDWLLDGKISPFNEKCAFLTAHNVGLIASRDHETKVHISSLLSPSQSILYSADIVWTSENSLIAAAGTVFGEIEIVVWELNSEHLVERSQIIFTFTGHEGSIFGVQISDEIIGTDGQLKRLLVSCSDDRTIRVWDLSSRGCHDNIFKSPQVKDAFLLRKTGFGDSENDPSNLDAASRCLAIVMGHASRIWGVKFLTDNNSNLPCSANVNILSFGEDATVYQWHLDYEDRHSKCDGTQTAMLNQISKFGYHSGKHIWSSGITRTNKSGHFSLATGGADGKVAFYEVSVVTKATTDGKDEDIQPLEMNRSWTLDEILQSIPNQPPNPALMQMSPPKAATPADEPTTIKHKKKNTSVAPKDNLGRYAYLSQDKLLATTSFGKVLLGSSKAIYDWQEILLPNGKEQDLKSHSIIVGAPEYKTVFLTGNSGTIYTYSESHGIVDIAKLDGKIAGLFIVMGSHTEEILLLATTLGKDKASILSLVVDAQCLKLQSTVTVKLPLGFVVTSAGSIGGLLVLGSRNGALAVYDLAMSEEPLPLTKSTQARNTDAITSIVNVPADDSSGITYFLTTARDGAYSILSLTRFPNNDDQNAQSTVTLKTVHKAYPPFGPVIESAWFDLGSNLFLSGFRSTYFVIWNATTETEVNAIDCGGAHRNHAYIPHKKAGGAGSFVYTKASKLCISTSHEPSHKIIKYGGHGREIKACAISPGQGLIATGAEDTAIRISVYNGEELNSQVVINHHTTGIQALQWGTYSLFQGTTHLFSAGGNEEFCVWSISHIPGFSGLGTMLEATLTDQSPEHDLRVMAFDVHPINSHDKFDQEYEVVMGFSDSTIRAYAYSRAAGFRRFGQGRYTSACLTQVCIMVEECHDKRRLLTAATDGFVALWSLPSSSSSSSFLSPSELVLHSRFQIHQSSILSLDIMVLGGGEATNVTPKSRFLAATGGDDNSLCLSLFENWLLVEKVVIPAAHAAAVTGVEILDRHSLDRDGGAMGVHKLVTVGGDQRVKVWTLGLDEESGLRISEKRAEQEIVSSVADAAGLVGIGSKIFVFGNGIEGFQIVPREVAP